MKLHIPFDNSYARLPGQMFTALEPTPVRAPEIIAVNASLAETLGIDAAALGTPEALDVFAGNALPDGAAPLAQAYAGHQFGNWNPQLGDGRAILLGEVIGRDGVRRDIQLKGAGPTPWSRMGDGRAWLGPVLREYLMSEAMHALGIPTTRALAAVTTGEPVQRETMLPGAVLTRVAQSHIRVGTFQFFAARGDLDALQSLTEHALARHYPQADEPTGLLEAVVQAQAGLIAGWMALGFIHGVMNTDNCAISGETIDYGPCAFMDAYHPGKVFSAIDQGGRYAYANQPQIAQWNMAQFATALIPLMPDAEAAVQSFTAIINRFPDLCAAATTARFAAKLGLAGEEDDAVLITDLLAMMAREKADFTNTFKDLQGDHALRDAKGFAGWEARWQARSPDPTLMAQSNPQVIPRTHLIEAAITAAVGGDHAPFHAMLAAVTAPFTPSPEFAAAPAPEERVLRTFCGT